MVETVVEVTGILTFVQDSETLELYHAKLEVTGEGELPAQFKFKFGKWDATQMAVAMGAEVANTPADIARAGMEQALADEADRITRGRAEEIGGPADYLGRMRHNG